MAKALENQQTNLRKARCGCTINGLKHDTEILAGEGYIVRTQSNDYKVYCKECYDRIAKRNAKNDKVATLQGDKVRKTTINDGYQHSFTFYINKNNIEAINLLKRLHYIIINRNQRMIEAKSPKESNLNGLQKNFTNLINNFNVNDNIKVTIDTYNQYNKDYHTVTKATLKDCIEVAKQQRIAL